MARLSSGDSETIAGDNTSHHGPEKARDADERDGAISEDGTDIDPTPDFPTGLKLFVLMTLCCLAVFIQALDNNVVSTAIPTITSEFNSLDDVGWYGSAYFLTTCACQLLWGRLYTLFNLKYMYMITIAIFELGEIVCATAPSSVALIVGRAIAGLGSAGIFSGSYIIIALSVPLHRRPFFITLVGVMYGAASASGPLIAGAFTANLTWRWCFYINLPLGASVIAGLFFFLENPAGSFGSNELSIKEKLTKLDIVGTGVFIASFICILFVLQWGGTTYPWSDGRIIALIVLFVIGIAIWVGVQYWRGENATVPGRIFFRRSVIFAVANAVCVGGAVFTFIYYIPLWMQAVRGDSPVLSGVHTIPMLCGMTAAELTVAFCINRTGYAAPFMLFAVVLASAGSGLMSTWHVGTPVGQWIGYQILFGLGEGCAWQQPILVVQTVLPDADIPTGTAVALLFQFMGGALFVSVAQNVFSNRLLQGLHEIGVGIDATEIMRAGATSLRSIVTPEQLEVILPVYSKAIMQTFYVAVALSALGIIGAAGVEWKNIRAPKNKA